MPKQDEPPEPLPVTPSVLPPDFPNIAQNPAPSCNRLPILPGEQTRLPARLLFRRSPTRCDARKRGGSETKFIGSWRITPSCAR
jgi:hypothetical protein